MRLAISEQALVFCWSVLLGVLLGIWYDVIRLLRLKVGRRRWLGCIWDAVFVLISCLLLLGFVLTAASGQMRWYVLFGVFLGGMLYASALSQTVFRILQVFSRVFLRFLRLFGIPFAWVSRGIYHLLLRIRDSHRKKKTKKPEETPGQA